MFDIFIVAEVDDSDDDPWWSPSPSDPELTSE